MAPSVFVEGRRTRTRNRDNSTGSSIFFVSSGWRVEVWMTVEIIALDAGYWSSMQVVEGALAS